MQICIRNYYFSKTIKQNAVFNRFKQHQKAIVKASMLLCVYALHLVFFQGSHGIVRHRGQQIF